MRDGHHAMPNRHFLRDVTLRMLRAFDPIPYSRAARLSRRTGGAFVAEESTA